MTHLPITPIAKPRMTRSDKWKTRPIVIKYRNYADELRAALPNFDGEAFHLVFQLPMPPSWSKRKRAAMNGTPHKQTPDLDNLIKAFLDALMPNDSHVWRVTAEKSWATEGAVLVKKLS